MMSIAGFKTKKSMKEAIKLEGAIPTSCLIETSMFGSEIKDGVHAIVGPSPYERKWYAQVTIEGDLITKVS